MGEASLGFLNANQAAAEGAITAGLKFFAGYPITPASDLFEYLAKKLPKYGGVVVQSEDEIAAINAIIGASWAGAKAMTATSGPGFSLMAESIGFAAMTETPIVIIQNMRAGPSTGVATATGQGEVMQSRWVSHGHYGIVVLTPFSSQEAYDLTIKAFNIAERLRVPVVVLMDYVLVHTRERVVLKKPPEVEVLERKKPTKPPGEYRPYEPDPEDLVPPMANYGEGYAVLVESMAHDERGYYAPVDDVYERLVKRLVDKIEVNRHMVVESATYHTDDAEVLFVAFGSVARSVMSVVKEARMEGKKYGLFRPISLWPLDEEGLRKAAENAEQVIVVEMNYGQLVREVERIVRDKPVHLVPLLKLDLPTPEEIVEAARRWL